MNHYTILKTLNPLVKKASGSQATLLKEAIQLYINKGIKKQIIELIKLRGDTKSGVATVFMKTEMIPDDKGFKKWMDEFWKLLKDKIDVKKEDIPASRVIDNIIAELKRKLKEEYPVPEVFQRDENQGASLVLDKGQIKLIPKSKPEPPKAVELPPPEEKKVEVPAEPETKSPEPEAKEAPVMEKAPEPEVAPKPEKALSEKTLDSYGKHLMRIKIGLEIEGADSEYKFLKDTAKVVSWIDNLKGITGQTLSASAIKTFYASALWATKDKPELADIYRAKMKGLKVITDATPSAPAPEPPITIPKEEFVAEHKELVEVLKADEPKEIAKELKKQETELKAVLTKPIEKHSKAEIASMIREHLKKKGKKTALSHLTKEELIEAYKALVV
jgi:hypothetical protein